MALMFLQKAVRSTSAKEQYAGIMGLTADALE